MFSTSSGLQGCVLYPLGISWPSGLKSEDGVTGDLISLGLVRNDHFLADSASR